MKTNILKERNSTTPMNYVHLFELSNCMKDYTCFEIYTYTIIGFILMNRVDVFVKPTLLPQFLVVAIKLF